MSKETHVGAKLKLQFPVKVREKIIIARHKVNRTVGCQSKLPFGAFKITAVDYGIYHFSGSPAMSWYDFAQTIINEATSLKWLPEKPKILPILSADYPSAAVRPAYSVLANHKIQAALKHTPCDWRKGLREMLRENIK